MAVHRRLRQATRNALSAFRGRRARKPKPSRKARRAAPRGNGPTIDERLAWIVADVRAGKLVECSWELFRLQHFPGWPHERVAAAARVVVDAAGHQREFRGARHPGRRRDHSGDLRLLRRSVSELRLWLYGSSPTKSLAELLAPRLAERRAEARGQG